MVLDVERFEHPGPQELITENIGTDCTELFNEQGHSKAAVEMCLNLKVGFIQQNQLLANQWAKVTQEEKEIHDKLDAMIDIRKPLIPQVRKLTNKEFLAFVRRPRQLDNEDGIILYADKEVDDYMKVMKDYPRNCKVILPIIFAYILAAYYLCDDLHHFLKQMSIYFVGGLVIIWTFTEYYYHRFLLHREGELDPNADADPDLLEEIFSSHIHHHVFMNQKRRIAIELDFYPKLTFPCQAIMHCFFPVHSTLMCTASWVLGALIYDGVHLAFHFNWDLNWIFPGFQSLKAHHMRHHFRDNSKEFGVTSELWDYIYGTTR